MIILAEPTHECSCLFPVLAVESFCLANFTHEYIFYPLITSLICAHYRESRQEVTVSEVTLDNVTARGTINKQLHAFDFRAPLPGVNLALVLDGENFVSKYFSLIFHGVPIFIGVFPVRIILTFLKNFLPFGRAIGKLINRSIGIHVLKS